MKRYCKPRVRIALALVLAAAALPGNAEDAAIASQFADEVLRVLPTEDPYTYHDQLARGPVHRPRRNATVQRRDGELEIPATGWRLVWKVREANPLNYAVTDFQEYLRVSMNVDLAVEERQSLDDWTALAQSIVVGTREDLPGCGLTLHRAKDYEIQVSPERIVVCGYDERGAAFGLYNLEARMNLREAPFLPADLRTVRHSKYDSRMVQSWLGWMEYPDAVLAHMAHDGFDAIYASVYANPNGDRTTAETSTDFYARLMHRIRRQDPARVHDLIARASRYGIKVYTPIIYQYLGTPESEADLRRLVREILAKFPDIHGYVLLTEGFWYRTWGGGHGASAEYMRDWAQNWCRAVGIVKEECHLVNPRLEVLPWEYNIDFRPQNVEMKRYFIQQLPDRTIPLLTWENGKSFEIDGLRGYLRDYAISQVGPAEVTAAQIAEARARGMKVYSNAQTFVCGAQLQTLPYHPIPHQWHERYTAMDALAIDGTLESWSTGYTPNLMTELRAWYCWSDAPPLESLLGAMAAREFGEENRDAVVRAWNLFGEAIRMLPDTGPYMGTGNATGNPIFFQQPPARTATFYRSWMDQDAWMGYLGAEINPYWPFTVTRMVFIPDFSNASNRAEAYARSVSGVEVPADTRVLPVFLKYLRKTTDRFGEGLDLYRAAALTSPIEKRERAVREVLIAEQIQRMLLSNHAILEFEDLRLQLVSESDAHKAQSILDRLEAILREEVARTERSLAAVMRDSRIGFQFETDYVFTPYSLREKLAVMREALERQLPQYRERLRNKAAGSG